METKKKRFTLDLDPDLKQRLKAAAAQKGVSMSQYCQDAIGKELANDDGVEAAGPPSTLDGLEKLLALKDEIFQGRKLPGNSVDFIREARESRSHL